MSRMNLRNGRLISDGRVPANGGNSIAIEMPKEGVRIEVTSQYVFTYRLRADGVMLRWMWSCDHDLLQSAVKLASFDDCTVFDDSSGTELRASGH